MNKADSVPNMNQGVSIKADYSISDKQHTVIIKPRYTLVSNETLCLESHLFSTDSLTSGLMLADNVWDT